MDRPDIARSKWGKGLVAKEFGRLFALLALSLSLAVVSATPAHAQDASGKARFAQVLEQAKLADPEADIAWLRLENAQRLSYFPPPWEKAKKAGAALEDKPAKALKMAMAHLAEDPLSIMANVVAERALQALGKNHEAQRHHNLVIAILRSITEGKDGRSADTAWNAVSVSEEYRALWLLELSPEGQSLVHDGGHSYDRFSVKDLRTGEDFSIWFNIDAFFGKQFEDLLKSNEDSSDPPEN